MGVERALCLSRWDGILPVDCQRLYFGAEFCSWAFPPTNQVLAAFDAARNAGLAFSLLTPVLREESLREFKSLFTTLKGRFRPTDEIVFSDFGALMLARDILPDVELVLGRVLSGQKRGPRITELELTEDARHYFRQGSWYSDEAVSLLQEQGVRRVELDSLLQGLEPLPPSLVGSLHTPYAMVTSSRNCPFHPDKSGRRCSAACGEVFRLSTAQTSQPLLQAGNTQFIEIAGLPEDPAALGIDRLVVHQRLPR